ncbi:MAG: hypothetical protein ACO3SQ_10400, partial [Ilumatobacteraceae bacterium]
MGSGADRDRSGGGASEAVSSELDGRGVDQLATDVDLSVVTSLALTLDLLASCYLLAGRSHLSQ